ncbi:MAG: DMT family transporter [Betaproteobacteria bacterium]|nr:DMT family transporter [Betaproteobacteria bacterium]
MQSFPPHARSVALMLIAPVLWSMAGVFVRQLEAAARWELVFLRSWFCVLAMLLFGAALYRRDLIDRLRKLGWEGWLSGALWSVQFTCFMLALTYTSVASTIIIISLAPLIATILAWLILKERVVLRTWVIVTVAVAGVIVIFWADLGAGGWVGNLIALAVPVAAGANWVLLRALHADVDLVMAVLVGGVIAGAASLPLALPLQATAADVGILAFLGFFQLALPCVLAVIAARHLSPTEMGLLGLLEVVLGPLWAWLWAGEQPAGGTLTGGGIILAAMAVEAIARGRGARPNRRCVQPLRSTIRSKSAP